jgi:hypothetical protein
MSDEQAGERRPFHEWLGDHRRGEASAELADELANVVGAVQLHGKKGRLRLTLDVVPAGRTVLITDQIEVKVPEGDRETAVYFGDAVGNLSRDDPAQGKLNLDGRAVDRNTGEIE